MDRHNTALVAMSVAKGELLVAMPDVAGVVDVQGDGGGPTLQRPIEERLRKSIAPGGPSQAARLSSSQVSRSLTC
jgi:uncharacterized protein (UPF0261 family)